MRQPQSIQAWLDPIAEIASALRRILLGWQRLEQDVVHLDGIGIPSALLREPGPRVAVADAHHDPVKPGPETSPPSEGRKRLVHLDKTLLHDIFRFCGASCGTDDQREHIASVAPIEFEERAFLTLQDLPDQCFIADVMVFIQSFPVCS